MSYQKIFREWIDYNHKLNINSYLEDFCRCIKPGAHILDLGCGSGEPIDRYLSKRGFEVSAIDECADFINYAQNLQLDNVTFKVADILKLKSNEMYDAIILHDVLWHFPHQDQLKLLQEIYLMLNEGGRCLFTHGKSYGVIKGEMFKNEFIYYGFEEIKLRSYIEELGFKIDRWELDHYENENNYRELVAIIER